MKKNLLLLFLILPFGLFAQNGGVSGQISDQETGEALIGASVVIQGTSTGAVTDINGAFSIANLENGNYTLLVNYVGYGSITQEVEVQGSVVTLDPIVLASSSIGLNEVMVIASMAIDRKTPVAVSTIKAAEIESKIGSQEFPEILKSTPGVYATKTGGGFGDGRINIRGFDSENVAVLINGVPVNDMENGRVYWSNWAGLTDATNTMQVQRGLGASKVAVPSVGGTINIISKASDREQGGSVSMSTGNNSYSKLGFAVSSGLNENGWAFTVSGARTKGAMYADGTEFLGYSYFTNISKQINKSHELSLTLVGAKQEHGQRQNKHLLADYENSSRKERFNSDWGYKNGQVLSVENNFYNKPQLSLNWYWTINEKMELSTAAYASSGTGGGGGNAGFSQNDASLRKDGVVDFDKIVDMNAAHPDGESLMYLRASRNDHKWYGVLSSLNYEINSNLNLTAGLDLRSYTGSHFNEVTDLLGGDFATDNNDVNNPNRVIRVGDKRSYYNDGVVLWQGGFAQVEYSKDKLSAFIAANVSSTNYKRIDYYQYLDSDPARETDWVNFLGFGAKGGANYNVNDKHNVYANIGYFERAPFFNAVFLNFKNDINGEAKNQKIFSYELGYGLRMNKLTANFNVYSTNWKDRTLLRSFQAANGDPLTANLTGVNAIHNGMELDFSYNATSRFEIRGMFSMGDWKWQNDLKDVEYFDNDNVSQGTVDLYIKDLKVGDAAQTTAALGASYKLMKGLKFGVDFTHASKLFADFDPSDRGSEAGSGIQAWEVPAFNLVDLNVTYEFVIGGMNSAIYANVFNVGDVKYVSDAQDGGGLSGDTYTPGGAANSPVYYGAGLTWNLALKVNF
jgi:outer membrane cobalamin receptor